MDKQKFTRWMIAAGIRAVKTFCQGCVALIGTDYINIVDIDWSTILGIAATMAVLSLLTSAAGLPELKEDEKLPVNEE